ncbi:MAG: biotin--[acetyl-CoA-carboxylase] ligase, partial [Oscillospiraceae bacterium]
MSAKYDVLKLLENNKGKTLSGNDIAMALGITRAAVWKVINTLKEDGYKISAVTKKGYCLETQNDILSPQSIKPYIHNVELYDTIIVHKSLSSTNTEAKALANNSAKSGTVIISEQQTQGKGRLGRKFYSPNTSGIYMSVIFRLKNPIEQSMLITSATAVAVCIAIKTVCNLDCQIKWVNDIYIDSKKVCGILTEASVNFEAQQLDYI